MNCNKIMWKSSQISILSILLFFLATIGFAESIEELSASFSKSSAVVSLRLDKQFQPQVRFFPQNSCWQLDFIGFENRSTPQIHPSPIGPLKLVKIEEIHSDPRIQRVSCFIRKGGTMRCKLNKTKVDFIFRFCDRSGSQGYQKTERTPEPLLIPKLSENEIILDVKEISFESLVAELSRQACLPLKFRNPLPPRISVKQRFGDPAKALEEILKSNHFVLTRETEGNFVTKQENPLLEFNGNDRINPKNFFGLTLRQTLKRLTPDKSDFGQIPENLVVSGDSETDQFTSSRTLVETLLNAHGLSPEELLHGA